VLDELARIAAGRDPRRELEVDSAEFAGGMERLQGGKEASDEDVKLALTIFEKNALPPLAAAYTQSGDVAIMNEATYYIGQIQLTRSQKA